LAFLFRNFQVLNISKEDFEKPEELSIEIDCGKHPEDDSKIKNTPDDDPEIDF
jgi:penicillin-binding protein 1A